MVLWIVFWLSVALIPVTLWLHLPIPPFSWHRKGVVKTSRAWLFGLLVIVVRCLLHIALVVRIAQRPLASAVPGGFWVLLTVGGFVLVEVGLALLHHVWIDRATGADRFNRPSIRVLGPAYFLGLMVESAALFWLLRAADEAV